MAVCSYTIPRRTICSGFSVSGVGLHTGEKVKVTLHPFSEGIRIRKGNSVLLVDPEVVSEVQLGVALEGDGLKVRTVEHLMGTLALLGITDVLIEIEQGEEIPILDGSGKTWKELITRVGTCRLGYILVEQEKRDVLILDDIKLPWILGSRREEKKPFRVVSFSLDWTSFSLLKYEIFWKGFSGDFVLRLPLASLEEADLISGASTFAHLQDIFHIIAGGFSRGASLENVLLRTYKGTSRPVRHPMELVIHKLLDSLGDIYLLGFIPRGSFFILNGGHDLHVQLARNLKKLLKNIVRVRE